MFKLIYFLIKATLIGMFIIGVLMILSAIAEAQTPSRNIDQFMERMQNLSQNPEPDDMEMMEYDADGDALPVTPAPPVTRWNPFQTREPRQLLKPRAMQKAYAVHCPTKLILIQSDDYLEMYKSDGRDRNGDLCVFTCYRSSTDCMHLQ